MPEASLPAHPDARIESVETLHQGRSILQRVRFRHRVPGAGWSETLTWELLRRGRAVAVLPYDPDEDAVVLIEQFRLPALAAGVDPWMVEIPAGMLEPGEPEADAARREALEEALIDIGPMERIGSFVLTPGICDETLTVFAGHAVAPPADPQGDAGMGGLPEEHEHIRIRVLPAEEAIALVASGRVENATTAIALLWLAVHRARLRREWPGREWR